MKKLFLISVIVCVFLTACVEQRNIPTAFPSLIPEPSSTATATPTETSQPSSISTSTITPLPFYQNKNVVFDYYIIGNQADFDMFFDPQSGDIVTRLVLYDDRQMLIAGAGETYKQKLLSSDEIKRFLSKLETLGFYSLESNQKHDPTDKLYDYGNNYQESFDGLSDCILVNADKSRDICVYESDMQFLIPKMKNILKYLDEYKPAGMTPYYPDRILLTIQSNIDPSIENPPAIPWDEHFPYLENDPNRFTSDTSNQVIYIDGDIAKEIYMFFEGSDGSRVVSQNGKKYIVYICVLLPHEKVKNPQQ